MLLSGAAAGAAETQSVRASYEIYFGGFHVLNAEAELEDGGQGYRIVAEAETQGMLSWFFSWKGETESSGLVSAEKGHPAAAR